MTLNDLERRNSYILRFCSLNSIALQADYVTVVEDRPVMSVKYCFLQVVPIFHFRPKLTHPSARSLCDSWATCYFNVTCKLATVGLSSYLFWSVLLVIQENNWSRKGRISLANSKIIRPVQALVWHFHLAPYHFRCFRSNVFRLCSVFSRQKRRAIYTHVLSFRIS